MVPQLPPPSEQAAIDHLENLLHHYSPLVAAASLYLLACLARDRAVSHAQKLLSTDPPALLGETATDLLAAPHPPVLAAFPTLEKLVYLFNSDFFHRLDPQTLLALAHQIGRAHV